MALTLEAHSRVTAYDLLQEKQLLRLLFDSARLDSDLVELRVARDKLRSLTHAAGLRKREEVFGL